MGKEDEEALAFGPTMAMSMMPSCYDSTGGCLCGMTNSLGCTALAWTAGGQCSSGDPCLAFSETSCSPDWGCRWEPATYFEEWCPVPACKTSDPTSTPSVQPSSVPTPKPTSSPPSCYDSTGGCLCGMSNSLGCTALAWTAGGQC